jgi:cytochrome c oxidase accessory protein FixG
VRGGGSPVQGSSGRRVIAIEPVTGDDSNAVTSLYQSEGKIYPRSVSGWFSRWRWMLVWATQWVFYGLPWMSIHERQAVLFDLSARRFYIFELVLYPQDLIYLTGLLIISALSLFLFTAVAGRLWCGYACPQTVYTEIFLWVERWTEGDRNQRIKLDQGGLSGAKLLRKTTKHLVWAAIGLWTGFTFVGYFTPIQDLIREVGQWSLGPWELFWILFYGFATYGNAGWMREQVCKYMCPYARFQSAMFDKDTLIVSYDHARGEGRGVRPRSEKPADYRARGLGDCIDCGLCVQVCPTGIDIREGLQYECISCSACIDVCNSVMDKMHYPRGLIRYGAPHGVNRSPLALWRRVLRPRVLIYSAALLAAMVAVFGSLALRAPFKVDVVRDRGSIARMVGAGTIENVYRLQIMNATELAQTYRLRVEGIEGLHMVSADLVDVPSASALWVAVRVQMPPAMAEPGSHAIGFRIEENRPDGVEVVEKSVFLVPR